MQVILYFWISPVRGWSSQGYLGKHHSKLRNWLSYCRDVIKLKKFNVHFIFCLDADAVSDTNSVAGGTGMRSSNAPSLGASRKGSMFDIAALDQTHSPIPEEGDAQCK